MLDIFVPLSFFYKPMSLSHKRQSMGGHVLLHSQCKWLHKTRWGVQSRQAIGETTHILFRLSLQGLMLSLQLSVTKRVKAFRSTSSFTFHLRKECEYHLFHIAMKQTKTGHKKTTSTCWQRSQGKDRSWWYTQQHRYVPGEQLQPASVESLPV